MLSMILSVFGAIVLIEFTVFFVFWRELRKETKLRDRSHHGTAYGKDRSVTAAAEDAAFGIGTSGDSSD